MTLVIEKERKAVSIKEMAEQLSGVNIDSCLQCKKCTNGCPVTGIVDAPPSEIIRRLQLNTGDEILSSQLVWTCASCETCFSRCPMKIDMAAVMDALRVISAQKVTMLKNGKVKKMNKAFLNSVRRFGRTYDIGMIAAYKLKTMNLLQDTDKFPSMLKKGKIALLPSFGADKKYIKRIFKTVKKDKI